MFCEEKFPDVWPTVDNETCLIRCQLAKITTCIHEEVFCTVYQITSKCPFSIACQWSYQLLHHGIPPQLPPVSALVVGGLPTNSSLKSHFSGGFIAIRGISILPVSWSFSHHAIKVIMQVPAHCSLPIDCSHCFISSLKSFLGLMWHSIGRL